MLPSLQRPSGRALAYAVLATAPVAAQGFDLDARRAEHWAWQPLAEAAPPDVDAASGPIDAFVIDRLQAEGLEPGALATPHVLLRRLWFDLVGMPPPPATVRRFAADPSDAAYDREVDELLASPHFGERWGRHWLDLVRYAETLGHEYDFPLPNAWRYRDYVIRAFNSDVPYDRFLREHIAGDLLAEPRRGDDGSNESIQATAAWWFVEQTHSPVDAVQHQADRIDNQIDVLGKAMLGLTVACARCHDHKFDAIAQADYYSLFGFVKSSRYVQAPIRPTDPDGPDYRAALAAQRTLATVWAETAAPTDARWLALGASPGQRWSASAGTGPLREHERIIASVDRPRDWILCNDAFGSAPWRGPWCPDPASPSAELFVLPGAFWHSGIAGAMREGALQTRTFEIAERYLHVRAAGRSSRIRVVVDGFHIIRNPIYGDLHQRVDKPYPHWITFDLGAWEGRPAYVQCIDQRTKDLGDPLYKNDTEYPADAWLAVQTVIASSEREAPAADPGVPLPHRPWNDAPTNVAVALEKLAAAQAALPISPVLPALGDGTGSDEHLYVRGNHHTLGALQRRRFLAALQGEAPMVIDSGSGRRELADAILARDNPLPARALVNRLWHHLFGRGLCRSVDNLGALGTPPTHPRLLDWLARDFMQSGWSIKHALRRIVRSHAYRQSSRSNARGDRVDPANLLLHRQNVRRLEAEAVRDSLLAISGRLDPRLYGPSIPIPHEDIAHARGKPKQSGPLDGEGRRSLYLAIRRNFMPPMLLAFDLPTPFATVGRRSVSNVPAQALTLLNDPFVHEMCRRWAERLIAEHGDDCAAGIDAAYFTAFARSAHRDELERCREFLAAAAYEYDCDTDDSRPWTDLLHCLVNTKEFTFRR